MKKYCRYVLESEIGTIILGWKDPKKVSIRDLEKSYNHYTELGFKVNMEYKYELR